MEHCIELRNVTRKYGVYSALQNVSLRVRSGEFVAIVGKSGSGKSTLLNMIGGIDLPDGGEVLVRQTRLDALTQDEIAAWRGRTIGVIFQFFQLLPTLTVLENVMIPMDFTNVFPPRQRKERSMGLLERLGISDQANKLPAHLSGGQQQRAAIARALANDPPILLADEPTGNLDSQTTQEILMFLQRLSAEGKTVLIVTHERDIATFVHRTIVLSDGRIIAGVSV